MTLAVVVLAMTVFVLVDLTVDMPSPPAGGRCREEGAAGSVMSKGRIVETGTTRRVVTDPRHDRTRATPERVR
ncbi:hypothetical protein [Nonomuraea sp. NPDC050643]|uniref:hypothetical protein n=1 Tax=Nonomuraea sp. NPDC050643 TaxID=3155660 RepID=UPI0034012285